MAQMFRAIPLDSSSHQPGDTNWKDMVNMALDAEFSVKHTTPGSSPSFTFTTKKGGVETNFPYHVSASGSTISAKVSKQDIVTIYNAAKNGDWDYVKCTIVAMAFDQSGTSELDIAIGGTVYDNTDWPPV